MSDGKSSSYTVVSAAELRRRALAAARDRVDRANDVLQAMQAEAAAAEMTYGELGVTVPACEYSSSSEPTDLDSLAARLETLAASTRERLHTAVGGARLEHFAALAQELSAELAPLEALPELPNAVAASRAPRDHRVETALRILARLPADSRSETVERVEHLVAAIRESAAPTRTDALMAALRESVQVEQERASLIDKNRAQIAELLTQLDGLEGNEPGRLRGLLRGLALDGDLPPGLASQVAHARREAGKAADREFARTTIRDVLVRSGYTVEDDFVTVLADDGAVILPLTASAAHGVQVRQRAGRLNFNVVRFTETDSPIDDATASTAFCESFAEIEQLAAEEFGLELTRVGDLPAGSTRLQLIEGASPFAESSTSDARRRQRRTEREANLEP